MFFNEFLNFYELCVRIEDIVFICEEVFNFYLYWKVKGRVMCKVIIRLEFVYN